MKIKLALAVGVFAMNAYAATSTTWEVSGFSDFLKGRFSGLSLTLDGTLALGPSVHFTLPLNQPALWSLAAAPDGALYAGTGHQGKVYRISPNGKADVVWSSGKPEVFAICLDSKGRLYAGTSPNGALYRIENDKATEVWRSPVKYIWGLQAAPDGSVFVATGERGQIYKVQPDGGAAVYYDTGQINVTALTLGPNGKLYAGTEPNGLLYEISGPTKGVVLYDSSLPEIRAIALAPDGTVYAAAMGGAVATRSGSAPATAAANPSVVTATSPTVITVTESASQTDDQQSRVTTPPQPQANSAVSSATVSGTVGVSEVSGVEKSAIYRITPSHVIETVRSSKEDNVYDLRLDGDGLLFSTDVRGRIYRLVGQQTTLLAELGDGETTRLVKSGSALYAGMSNPGRVFALGSGGTGPGSYESQVHDASSVARWGHLQWRGGGSGVVFKTRTGTSARPDASWSDWSAPLSGAGTALIQSPPARFVQWRAEWPAGSTSQLEAVDIPYLPQNTPPAVHSVTVASVIGTNAMKSGANAAASTAAYSITVTDTGQAPAASSGTTATQTVSRLQTTQTQISWQADDPDGDKLAYSVYFRAEDEKDWQLIRSRMYENSLLLDPDVFADGRYYFRVVASDSPANSVEFARQTELISSPILIDNTPPVITIGVPHATAMSIDVDIEGTDKTSPLRLCEYSLDAGSWQPLDSADGVTDSPREQFHVHLEKLRPGEHLLVFRIYDSGGNAGLGRIVLHQGSNQE